MGMKDRAENAAQNLKGKAEETWGKATGDDEAVVKGKADQVAAKAKDAVEDVKDKLSD